MSGSVPPGAPCPAWCVLTHEPVEVSDWDEWYVKHRSEPVDVMVRHADMHPERHEVAQVFTASLTCDEPEMDEPRRITVSTPTDSSGEVYLTPDAAELLAAELVRLAAAVRSEP